jgi:hypothetical protein
MVNIDHTADDWQLYSGMEGREDCAQRINAGVADAINRYQVRETAYDQAAQFLERKENHCFGAADTEGLVILDRIFQDVYGPLG